MVHRIDVSVLTQYTANKQAFHRDTRVNHWGGGGGGGEKQDRNKTETHNLSPLICAINLQLEFPNLDRQVGQVFAVLSSNV